MGRGAGVQGCLPIDFLTYIPPPHLVGKNSLDTVQK